MLTRRQALYAGGAGLAALFIGRLASPPAAKATTNYEVTHTDAEWRKLLMLAQYDVLRQEGTERPFTSELLKEHRDGTFACAGCDLPLLGRRQSSKAAPAGRAFGRRSTKPSTRRPTARSACREPQCRAIAAAAISATSSTTGRSRPACAIA